MIKQSLSQQELRRQNMEFENTGGISEKNRCEGFQAAFFDTETSRAEVARFSDGSAAPFHILDGVPAEWVTERAASGKVLAVKSTVIAGFIRDGVFYTREQASDVCTQESDNKATLQLVG